MTLKNSRGREALLPIMKKNREENLSLEEIRQLQSIIVQFGGIEASYEKIKYLSDINRQLIKDLEQNSKITIYLEKMLHDLEVKK